MKNILAIQLSVPSIFLNERYGMNFKCYKKQIILTVSALIATGGAFLYTVSKDRKGAVGETV